MPAQTIGAFAVNGQNVGTFVDVLRFGSALASLTQVAGGQVLPGLDFRDHKLPVVVRTSRPSKYAEGAARSSTSSTTATADLNVEIWEDWVPQSVEFERNTDPAGLVGTVVGASATTFPVAFDIEVLNDIVTGGSITSVEYDATDPIGSLSSLLSGYDETSYGASGLILTRAGARKLGYATDTQARLQATAGVQSLFDGPVATTGATGTELGSATLMGIVGPFHAGAWGANGGLTTQRREDATVDGFGPGNGYTNYLNRAAFGYANGIDRSRDGTGFSILIDAV